MGSKERSRRFRERHPDYYKTPERREAARKRVADERAASEELRAKRVEQERERRYKRLYDITIEDYDKMLAEQDGVCAICGTPPKNQRLAVDHDHKTGDVRGLLCYRCNTRLGEGTTVDWLYNAYYYLDVPPVFEALGRTPKGVVGRTTTRRKRKKKDGS